MRHCLNIARKDLKTEFRTKQMLNSMLLFALLAVVIFSFAFGPFPENVDQLAPGILWVAFTFAGMLGLSRSFASEKENGCLDGLKLCPVDRSDIYVGKAISNMILMLIMVMVTVPVFMVLFDYSIPNPLGLMFVIVLGTLGFVFVGTLLSALTVNVRARELLLPVILFPVILPVIISAVLATGKVLGGINDIWAEVRILSTYGAIFFIVSLLIFEYVIED
ncbi:MAG: heme exporter protein CcmB [Methanosarcinales archaeon Met12]|nr:MAG: heme exporter protein CcmB [Methanosarcinales archaeon Met12]